MPKLQAFNQLFEELEQTVATLTKQENDLKASNTLLESRNTFLTGEIAKLEAQKQRVLVKVEDANQDLVTKTADIKSGIKDVEAETTKRRGELATELSEIEGAVESKQRELKEVNQDVVTRRKSIQELSITKAQLETAIKGLDGKIDEKRSELKGVQLEIEEARTRVDQQLVDTGIEIAQSERELKAVKRLLDDANDDLESIKEQTVTLEAEKAALHKRHDEFLEYEKKVKKALESREAALLEGEARLAQRSRRSSVLDNIN